MIERSDITATLIDLLPEDQRLTLREATLTWYMNIRANGGCRLTKRGYETLCQMDLQTWYVDIDPKSIRKRTLLELDRKIQFPFYLDTKNRRLVLFGSREAMMATLYGNISAWLNSISR